LTFNGLLGVISQVIVFFITTGVKTLNPTYVVEILFIRMLKLVDVKHVSNPEKCGLMTVRKLKETQWEVDIFGIHNFWDCSSYMVKN
jgi:hypothetical protein